MIFNYATFFELYMLNNDIFVVADFRSKCLGMSLSQLQDIVAVEYYFGRYDDVTIQQGVQVFDNDWQNVMGVTGRF